MTEISTLSIFGSTVPKPWLEESVKVVRDLQANATTPTADKREVAVSILTRVLHVSDNWARLLVELAVFFLKHHASAQSE